MNIGLLGLSPFVGEKQIVITVVWRRRFVTCRACVRELFDMAKDAQSVISRSLLDG
jgi:hypothetical protein